MKLAILLLSAAASVPCTFPAGTSAAFAPPPTPTNFQVQAIDNGGRAKLTWNASSSHIRITRRRLMPNGNPDPDSIHSWNVQNVGQTIDNPNNPRVFQYRIRAKQGSAYSDWTAWRNVTITH